MPEQTEPTGTLAQVIIRLKQFGVTVEPADYGTIEYCISVVEQKLKNFLNTCRVPQALTLALVDMVCGEYLFLKKSTGSTDIFENIDPSNLLVKQITEGKTTTVFDTEVTAPSTALDFFIQNMRQGGLFGGSELYNFRRMPGCRR